MSEEQEQLPDWLLSMRGQSLDESLDEPLEQQASVPPFSEEPPQEETAPPLESSLDSLGEEAEAVQERADQPDSDMVDLLRDMVQPDEEIEDYSYGKESRVSGVIPGMTPFQSLVLAVLFALDVLVCGCMSLAMLGKIGF